MKKEILYISDLHFEHVQWKRELLFLEDELKSFKNRLEELINRWTDKNVLTQLEHYQNQFKLHEGVIDTLQHDIIVHESNMAEHSKKGEIVLDRILVKKHIKFRSRLEAQKILYNDLKKEFFRFLSKYM